MAMNYTTQLTTAEIGMIIIGLNAFHPMDRAAELAALRIRLTAVYASRDPETYAKLVERGDIEPIDTPEVTRAKAVLAAAGQPVAPR